MTEEKLEKDIVLSDDLFEFVKVDEKASEKIATPEYSYWGSVFRKFFSSKVAVFMLVVLIAVLAFAFIQPMFSGFDNLNTSNINNPKMRFIRPNWEHPFGTDDVGRPVFDLVWAGARTSLSISFITTFITMTLGIIVGTVWGFNKKLDFYLMDIYNIVSNIPYTLIVMILSYTLGAGVPQLIFALSATSWIGVAYFMRVQVMIIRDREYNMASKVLGSSTMKIITHNILPQLISIIVTSASTRMPAYVSTEVFLGYIGLGLTQSTASLGRTIQDHSQYMQSATYLFIIPVAVLAVITVSFYIVGQKLADASDPRNHGI
ncbi:oligopeptide ABC transporter permease OppC [Helcococcus sueciensis]|uniref:oligopeptide ABC transporter permease OppC n=1 Tax=Helcococcus sueciensis TaxID=241555 RepID=UPI000423B96E|nr:oligopeptide ABC transporter permease OppC [Helcococcus sueciensis]